jgi:hypothetical protein
VRAILFGMNADELELDLAKIFPDETVIHNVPAVTDDISNILCFLSSPNARLDFAVDIRSSSFQRKVWNVLRRPAPDANRNRIIEGRWCSSGLRLNRTGCIASVDPGSGCRCDGNDALGQSGVMAFSV